ncbi:MAG: T9SS type A sorting domain-containing protein [Flavobacteriales bacterium]|nr:T9SS type A sorting domain-containing protein [Flavobacteriales bacterium]
MQRSTSLHLLLAVACVCLFSTVQAQTYFYVDEIAVTPADPTEQDNVQLQLIGNLSSTGSSVATATAQVNGFAVELTLVTQNTIGLDVLVPHTETIDVGLLPAGTYTVNVAGFGVYDGAPFEQHVFTVSGGGGSGGCDSLLIGSIQWAAFSDTALVLHAFNSSTTLFDYPGFLLLSDNGDTLARETVDLFGIGTESTHILNIPEGENMPVSPFNATLQLWTGFFSELACTWDRSIDLCPPDSCSPMLVHLGNFGDALGLGAFTYTVLSNGIPITSGLLTLTVDQQSDQDTLCLQSGNYELHLMPQQEPTGGQLVYGVADPNGTYGPAEYVSSMDQNEIGFTFYGPCADPVQSVTEFADARLVVSVGSGFAILSSTDGRSLGELRVMDAQGRLILAVSERTARYQFSTDGWASGVYVLQTRNADGQVLTARIVIG